MLPARNRVMVNARRLRNSLSLPAEPFCRASITFLTEESQERSLGMAGKLRVPEVFRFEFPGWEDYARPLNFFLISS